MKRLILCAAIAMVLIGTSCGRRGQQATPEPNQAGPATPAENAPAAETALDANDAASLEKLEATAPVSEPVTKENYEEQLNKLEAEIAADK